MQSKLSHRSYRDGKFTVFLFVCLFVIVVLLCDVTYEKLCVYEKSSLWVFCQLHTCRRAPPDHM